MKSPYKTKPAEKMAPAKMGKGVKPPMPMDKKAGKKMPAFLMKKK